MAHIPVEILLQIIQAAVDTIPIPDLVRMRLVNSLFSNEITTLLLQSPRLEDDGFGFAHESRHAQGRRYKKWWTKFPTQWKRQYLHQKVQQHPTNRCIFTTSIHELLAIPHAPRTKDQEHILIDKLIDAWLCGRFRPFRDVYDHRRFTWQAKPWISAERTMDVALATSAIIRGDCAELKSLIDRHYDPNYGSLVFLWGTTERFGWIRLLEVAGAKGSPEAIQFLLANDSKGKFENWCRLNGMFELAAKLGNMGAVKGWIDYFKRMNEDLEARLSAAVMTAVRVRRPDVVEFIEEESGIQFDKSHVLFDMFMDGVVRMRMSQVQYYLNWGGFDINMQTERFRYGPVNGAIYRCKGVPDLQLVAFLLEHGADPNRFNPTAKLTPLQIAVQTRNVALAKLLIEYGADINASLWFQRRKSTISLLQVAVDGRSVPMVRFLIENGLDREYMYKGRTVEVRGDTVEGDNSQLRFQRKMQDGSKPVVDETGYVVFLGDKAEKHRTVVGSQA